MIEWKEICWNVINCLIAAGLVFLGSLSNGNITEMTFIFAGIAAGIVFLTQFKVYWDAEKQEYYNTKFLQFV